MKKVAKILAIVLVLATVIIAVGEKPVSAAGKKTVRVFTEKQLKKALKNSSIDTIYFKTEIETNITINTKKAKKKNIIIDASNCNIINKSKFKSIELRGALSYTEDVSSNTITTNGYADFIIAEGRSVKKVTFTSSTPVYVVRKGASIKTVAMNVDGDIGVFDKNTNTMTLQTKLYEEDCSWDDSYIYDFDGSGRLLGYKESTEYNDGPKVTITQNTYDENGNLLKLEAYDYDSGDMIYFYTYNYDNENRMIESCFKDSERITYKYDSKGVKTTVLIDNDTYHSETKYTYDSNGRISKTTTTSYYIDDGVKSDTSTAEITYKYDKYGNCISYINIGSDGYKDTYTYKFDKSGNRIYAKYEIYYPYSGETSVSEEKMEYDELGNQTSHLIKTPYTDDWDDPHKYAG